MTKIALTIIMKNGEIESYPTGEISDWKQNILEDTYMFVYTYVDSFRGLEQREIFHVRNFRFDDEHLNTATAYEI